MTDPVVYDFDTQRAKGEMIEHCLDCAFAKWYDIRLASAQDQKNGIDRWYARPDGEIISVEYKADFIAHKTGNAYIETISVAQRNVSGWAYTSQAELLMYCIVKTRQVLIIRFDTLRENIKAWVTKYRMAVSHNGDYDGQGILVPLSELRKIAIKVKHL